jgi:membrane fusion protein (multidrug efflux system)
MPRARHVIPFTAFLALACSSGGTGATPGGPPPAIPVKVVTLAAAPLEHTLAEVGTIEAVDSVVLQPEITGVVVELGFEDGQPVHEGDVMARLRGDAARAQVDDAEARTTLAQAKLDRVQALFDQKNASRQELDQATADRDLARAAVDLARDTRRKTEIRAPFDGVAGRRLVSVGATVTPTTAITRVDALAVVTVDAAVPERELASVTNGQAVRVTVQAWPDSPFEGVITYVAPRLDAATRTVPIRARIENADLRLRPGMTARITIVTSTTDAAFVVPTEAIVTGPQGAAVYVAGADDKAVMKPIHTGTRFERTIEVLDGVDAGDRVIVEGLVKLQPGSAVQIVGDAG